MHWNSLELLNMISISSVIIFEPPVDFTSLKVALQPVISDSFKVAPFVFNEHTSSIAHIFASLPLLALSISQQYLFPFLWQKVRACSVNCCYQYSEWILCLLQPQQYNSTTSTSLSEKTLTACRCVWSSNTLHYGKQLVQIIQQLFWIKIFSYRHENVCLM